MKLFMFVSYGDCELRVFKDQEEAEKVFKQEMDYEVDGNFNKVIPIEVVDGYGIEVVTE